ncbi:insulin receptor-like [Oscarella lobularis]|uniref:insulin receptor-like n=1 Tax=Oscarella lobularis TaxID=121494 RepID=UPI0033132F4F
MRMLSFFLLTLSDLLTFSNAMAKDSNGKVCKEDLFDLRTRLSVKRLNQKNCTTIDGSLYIDGLEPVNCSNSGPLALETVTNITGYLLIKNLSDSYQRFAQLLPNLRFIGGKCGSAYDNYTFILKNNHYLETFGLNKSITLENGCAHDTGNVKLKDDFSSVLTKATTEYSSNCSSCSLLNHFYCPPLRCCGSYSVSNELDLAQVKDCFEIENNFIFSGNWSDEQMPKLEQAFGRLRKIHGYLVIAHTRRLKSLSFLKSLVSIGETKVKWNGKYHFALIDNSHLMHLWDNANQSIVNATAALVHGNPFLCKSDYNMLVREKQYPDGEGNSLVGECNWSFAKSRLSINRRFETFLEVEWKQTFKNENGYRYLGTELFYAEVTSKTTNIITTTCPSSLEDILRKNSIQPRSHQSLYISENASKKKIFGLTSGRYYAVYVRSSVLSLDKALENASKQLFDCSGVEIFSTKTSVLPPIFEPLNNTNTTCSSIAWSIAQKPKKVPTAYYFEIRHELPKVKQYEDYSDTAPVSTDMRSLESKLERRSTCPCMDYFKASHEKGSNGTFTQIFTRCENGNASDFLNPVLNSDTFSVTNVSNCLLYHVRAKVESGGKCSIWSEELTVFPTICSDEVQKEMFVSVTFYTKNASLVVNWTDPVTSLCNNKLYEIEVSGRFSALAFTSSLLSCSPSNQIYTCKLIMSPGNDKRRLEFKLNSTSCPPSRLRIKVLYYFNGERAEISFSVHVAISTTESSNLLTHQIATAIGSFSLIITALVACSCLWRMKAKRRRELKAIRDYFPEGYFDKSGTYKPDEWEIDRKSLNVGKLLGEGAFGEVYKGSLEKQGCDSKPVAIKGLKPNSKPFERCLFLKEASVMKNFVCDYIVCLIGIVSKGNPVYVVIELMENGDLKSYLRLLRPTSESSLCTSYPFSEKAILTMAAEIASGMAYLAEKKIVHRDLAARNCMVSSDKVVKIGDFGMARDIQLEDYYRKHGRGPMPIRWMAPESLRDGIFTHCSDVWSYGVVLWEIAALGALPYTGMSNEDVISFIGKRKQLHFGDWPDWPEVLKRIMRRCWDYEPLSRPTFFDILLVLPPLQGCEVAI